MTRTAHVGDVFNAIAEPLRREVIAVLSDGREYAVNEVVVRMRMAQPAVSKQPEGGVGMCPFCIGTAIWIAAGAVAAGGATALTTSKLWKRRAQEQGQGGEHDEQ